MYNAGYSLYMKGYHNKLSNVDNAIQYCQKYDLDVAKEAYEIASISRAIQDIENGKKTGYMVKLDTKQSGITIQSLILRDHESMKVLGIQDNTNNDLYQIFVDAFDGEFTRKEMKKIVIPRFYGSYGGILNKLGSKARADKFCDMYAKLLPKCDKLRQVMLDVWDDQAIHYYWKAPDGLEIMDTVEEVPMFYSQHSETMPEECCTETDTVEWKDEKGGRHNTRVYYSKPGCRVAGVDEHTKGLGANLIHSLDAYIMRELITRCAMSKRYSKRFLNLKRSKAMAVANSKVEEMYQVYKDTGICSLRVMEFVTKGDDIQEDYYDAIALAISHLPRDHFDVIAVHDEFACKVNYAQQMQRTFNGILAEIYRGEYLNYAARMFHWDKLTDTDLVASRYDKTVESQILHSDYLLQ